MFDIFGLRKEMDPGSEPTGGGENGGGSMPAGLPGPAKNPRRLWAVLLVLDSVFLIVFGGALAGMLYIRVTQPLVQVKGTPRPLPKRGQPAAAPARNEAPSPDTPAKAEPAKPEPAKPEPAKAPVKAEPIKPEPAKAPVKVEPVKTPNDEPKVRARAVEFSHRAAAAKEVDLRGPFLVRTGGRKPMSKDADGIWRATISLLPGLYKFHFTVDGNKTPPESVTVDP